MRSGIKVVLTGSYANLLSGELAYIMSLLSAIVQKDICRRYNVSHTQTIWEIANNLLDKNCQEVSYNALQKLFEVGSVHNA